MCRHTHTYTHANAYTRHRNTSTEHTAYCKSDREIFINNWRVRKVTKYAKTVNRLTFVLYVYVHVYVYFFIYIYVYDHHKYILKFYTHVPPPGGMFVPIKAQALIQKSFWSSRYFDFVCPQNWRFAAKMDTRQLFWRWQLPEYTLKAYIRNRGRSVL